MFESWMDFMCPAAIFVAFLAAIPWGRKPWWLVDAATNFTCGLGLILIPQYVLGFQIVGKMDEVHLHLCRITGTALIGQAVSWYYSRNSADNRMFGSQMYTRIMVCTFLLVAQLYSAYHLWHRSGHRFNDKYLTFSCFGVFLWLLGSLFQMIKCREFGGYIHKNNWLHTGLLIDSYLSQLLAIASFAFPSQILKLTMHTKFRPDGVHVCLFRTIAALMLGQAWSSHYCQGFLYMEDKQAHILGRLTVQILSFVINTITLFFSDIFSIDYFTPFIVNLFYVTFLMSLYYRARQKDKDQ
uniref:Uncharacterized protein n=1 Tax=Romanomermis culicivorax TaxID=13658 RepID=A0A915HIB7_ROMCU